jgi:hypothetical protein
LLPGGYISCSSSSNRYAGRPITGLFIGR